MLISVILPAYNVQDTIGESIDSILSQTFTDFELIIINDGSQDNTEEVILAYSDKRIRYYQNEGKFEYRGLWNIDRTFWCKRN